ncbi:hypothetical protein RB195_013012 [Necator americanus]|uniref:Protein CNPPD1 n=1 Tax=Necator americanus TaxID=51031 RepID=A0ABR1DUT2_NECAM
MLNKSVLCGKPQYTQLIPQYFVSRLMSLRCDVNGDSVVLSESLKAMLGGGEKRARTSYARPDGNERVATLAMAMAPQFPDFRRVRRRIRRTLCYGAKQPHTINLPLSELVVDFFNKRSPFDYMRPETSASISGRGYADPCTLVVAMVYLDRLRVNDKVWFESSDPTDLYLPALVVASKFLHDSDTYDRVSNADWAEAANISNQHLNQLEWEFVQKMNWDVMVDQTEFDRWLSFFEHWVANDFVMKNGFCTYNEILQLSSSFPLASLLQAISSFFGLMTLVYTLSIVSLFSIPSTLLSTETSLPENITVRTMQGPINFPSRINEEQPISLSTEYDFIEELDIDLYQHVIEADNISTMAFSCRADFEKLDCNVYEHERFPNRFPELEKHFTDFTIHPFLNTVS